MVMYGNGEQTMAGVTMPKQSNIGSGSGRSKGIIKDIWHLSDEAKANGGRGRPRGVGRGGGTSGRTSTGSREVMPRVSGGSGPTTSEF